MAPRLPRQRPPSWFLNKIVSADGMDSITLTYASETYSYYTLALAPVIFSDYYANTFGKNGVDVVKNMVNGVRLRQINFANGHINFTPSPAARQDLSDYSSYLTDNANTTAFSLGSISIYNNSGFCKKDSLFYSYWQDNRGLNSYLNNNYSWYNIHSDAYRLRLDSIQETSCDNAVQVPPYKFSYFDGTPPRKLSFGVDHWGFANDADTNHVMVPTYTVITQGAAQVFSGANRDASWPAMQNGSLQQLQYPTGGSSTFEFEPKTTYTLYSSVFQDRPLTNFAVHYFGQSAISQTMSITLSGDGACTIHVTNMSTNFSPTLVIRNSSNTIVYNSYYINYATTNASGTVIGTDFDATVNLPEGNYSATLSFDTGNPSSVINGAYGSVGQWQWYPVQTQQLVGGLRIKSITTKDGVTSNDMVTSYTYPGGGASSTGGTLYSIPTYVQVVRNNLRALVTPLSCSPNGCISCDGWNAHDYFVSPGSIQPMATMQGEHMGYDEVDVTRTGQGKTVYQYYGSDRFTPTVTDVCVRSITQSSLCDINIPSFPFPPVPFEFMRGELKFEGQYNESGTILQGTYHYPVYALDPLTTPGLISVNRPGLFSNTEYQLQDGYKIQDQEVSNTYDPLTGNGVTRTTTTYYGSAYHHQPTRQVVTTSTGDSLSSNTRYAFDYRITSCDAIPDSLSYYKTTINTDSMWMYSNLSSCTPQTNDATNCRLQVYSQFRVMMAQARTNLIAYRRRSYTDPGNLQSSCYLAGQGTADDNLRPILRLQNEYWNAPIETASWKNLNLLHATFNKYDTSLSPVGYVYPGRTQLINLQAPSVTFNVSAISGNTIVKDSRYLDETIYLFSKANPQQVIGHDGIGMSYLWDYANKEPIAKVTNATVDQVAYTSFEADGNGSWTIGSSARDGVGITGTSSFNLAGGNNCSRSGLSSATTYIVSYWSRTGSNYMVTGTTSIKQGKTVTINNISWTYFEHTVSGVSTVTLSGAGDVDELRLYPAAAQMTSYTYQPLVGITSQCDVNNRITYYDYDQIGRLNTVRDQDGNVIKTIDYHYKPSQTAF